MILQSLHLQHYKQYERLALDFKEGLTGIIGRNGAGKSTIFEAVLVCLFGDMRTDKKLIRSSWATTKKPVSLELTFEVHNKEYKIVREYRGKTLTHYAHLYDHKEEALATGATPVSKEVERLIGMDKDAFTRSIFSGQKELGEISNTRGEERRKMVRKMVGLDKLDKIQNIVREDRNVARNKIKGQLEMLLEEEEVTAYQKELKLKTKEQNKAQKELEKLAKQLQEKQNKYEAAQKEFDNQNKLYKTFNDLNTELTRFEAGIETLGNRDKEYDLKIEALQNLEKELIKLKPKITDYKKQEQELEQLEKEKDKFEQLKSLQEQQKLVNIQVAETKKQLEELAAIPDRIKKGNAHTAELDKSIKTNQLELKTKEKTLNEAKSALSVVLSKIEERNQQIKQINELGKEAECPTCFQPMIDSYESTLLRFQKDIDAYSNMEKKQIQQSIDEQEKETISLRTTVEKQQADLQKANTFLATLLEKQKQRELLQHQLTKIQHNLKTYQEQIKTLGQVNFDQNKYKATKSAVESFKNDYINYRSQQDDVAKLPAEIKAKQELLERIEKGKTKVKEKKQELKRLNFSEKDYQATRENQKNREQERDGIRLLHNQQKEVNFNIDSTIQSITQVLEKEEVSRANIKEKQIELETLDTLEATFTKFKSKALDRVRPIISNYASMLFTQITKGRYESIAVDENFEFYIYDNSESYPITRFSGGEIDLANLCLRIGISKAISELSGSSAAMSLLCFDEIFGSQDEDRRFEILRALDLLKEQYRQIYIVSHIESIKDYFPNILQIKKEREGSTVEWL